MWLDILYAILILFFGHLAIVCGFLAWKVFKCPDSLWKEMQRTPYNKSYDVMQRFWNRR